MENNIHIKRSIFLTLLTTIISLIAPKAFAQEASSYLQDIRILNSDPSSFIVKFYLSDVVAGRNLHIVSSDGNFGDVYTLDTDGNVEVTENLSANVLADSHAFLQIQEEVDGVLVDVLNSSSFVFGLTFKSDGTTAFDVSNSSGYSVDITSDVFPDDNVINPILDFVDMDRDGIVEPLEMDNIGLVLNDISTTVDLRGLSLLPLIELSFDNCYSFSNFNLTDYPFLKYFTYTSCQDFDFDFSHCPNLEIVYLNNSLSLSNTIDVSSLTLLQALGVESCGLSLLDVSNCTSLSELYINGNGFPYLNLDGLNVQYNDFATAQQTCNSYAPQAYLYGDGYLKIQIDDNLIYDRISDLMIGSSAVSEIFEITESGSKYLAFYVPSTIASVSDLEGIIVSYSYNTAANIANNVISHCGFYLSNVQDVSCIAINETNFPDTYFRQYVADNFDTDSDLCLSTTEISHVAAIVLENVNISSLQGIQYFTSLHSLECNSIGLTSLDVSLLPSSMQDLTIINTPLGDALDLTACANLKNIYLSNVGISTFDCPSSTVSLSLPNNSNLISVNTNSLPAGLTLLALDNCNFSSFDISHCPSSLTSLSLSSNHVAAVNLDGLNLEHTSLGNLSGQTLSSSAYVTNGNTVLWIFLPSIDASRIDSVDFSWSKDGTTKTNYNVDFTIDSYNGNPCVVISDFTSPADVEACSITYWYNTKCSNTSSDMHYMSVTLSIDSYEVISECVDIDDTHFPDSEFRSYISSNFDTDSDDKLCEDEVALALSVTLSSNTIESIEGIEYLSSLTSLDVSSTSITTLDLSKNISLTSLSLKNIDLTSVDFGLSKLINLTSLSIVNSSLSSIDVSNLTKLTLLKAVNNHIMAIDLQGRNINAALNPQNVVVDATYNVDTEELSIEMPSTALNSQLIVDYCSFDGQSVSAEIREVDGTKFIVFSNPSSPFGDDIKSKSLSYAYRCNTLDGYYFNVLLTIDNLIVKDDCLNIDAVSFPDEIFRGYVSSTFDTNSDGKLCSTEILNATSVDLTGLDVASIKGIEYLTQVEELTVSSLTSLTLSSNTNLKRFSAPSSELHNLDLSAQAKLESLNVSSNLESLALSNSAGSATLVDVSLASNKLWTLNLDGIISSAHTVSLSPQSVSSVALVKGGKVGVFIPSVVDVSKILDVTLDVPSASVETFTSNGKTYLVVSAETITDPTTLVGKIASYTYSVISDQSETMVVDITITSASLDDSTSDVSASDPIEYPNLPDGAVIYFIGHKRLSSDQLELHLNNPLGLTIKVYAQDGSQIAETSSDEVVVPMGIYAISKEGFTDCIRRYK